MIAQNTRLVVRYVPSIICFSSRWRLLSHFVENSNFVRLIELMQKTKYTSPTMRTNLACSITLVVKLRYLPLFPNYFQTDYPGKLIQKTVQFINAINGVNQAYKTANIK